MWLQVEPNGSRESQMATDTPQLKKQRDEAAAKLAAVTPAPAPTPTPAPESTEAPRVPNAMGT
jgi:hypothetical protein